MQVEGDDQARGIFCISHRSLPLWLATIHPNKVSPAARAKLIAYKREAAEVLPRPPRAPRALVWRRRSRRGDGR